MSAAGGGALLLNGLTWYFSEEQVARRGSRAPAREISAVADGERARIVGRVVVAHPIEAPLSGRACACYRALVHRQPGGPRTVDVLDERACIEVVDEHEGVEFFVEDATGLARVDVRALRIVSRQPQAFQTDATPRLAAFLHGHGSYRDPSWRQSLRYREDRAEPGDLVAVVGIGRWERDRDGLRGGAGYRAEAKRLVLVAPARGPLLVCEMAEAAADASAADAA